MENKKKITIIIVKDVIESDLAVSTEKGNKVFELINAGLKNKNEVILDFNGITVLITAFLNAAIGKLYGNQEYTGEHLNKYLKLINVDKDDQTLFLDVIQRAKEYYSDKDSFDSDSNNAIYGND